MKSATPAQSFHDRPRVSGSKASGSAPTFGTELPDTIRIERSLERFLDVWGAEVEGEHVRVTTRRAILEEVGMDPTRVAFLYGSTTAAVEKLRGRYGRDRKTGVPNRELVRQLVDGDPVRRAPLTSRQVPAEYAEPQT
jgi:hypothetical protein